MRRILLVLASLLVSGCLFWLKCSTSTIWGPGDWKEPGLYVRFPLADLPVGYGPATYENMTACCGHGLLQNGSSVAQSRWGEDYRLDSVAWNPADPWPAWQPVPEGYDLAADGHVHSVFPFASNDSWVRFGFVEFASRVTCAAPTLVETWADGFMASFEWGGATYGDVNGTRAPLPNTEPQIRKADLPRPFCIAALLEDLVHHDSPEEGASQTLLWPHWQFSFTLGIQGIVKTEPRQVVHLGVDANDRVNFYLERHDDRQFSDAEIVALIHRTFSDLGLGAPSQEEWQISHGGTGC